MMAWLQKLFGSSIGKKLWMALTGLLLLGFLVVHLAENLLLFSDRDGAAFDGYVHTLTSFAWIPLAELVLAGLFLAHIVQAIRVSLQNRAARSTPYALNPGHGGRTLASKSMLVTGSIVLLFLILHLAQFRFGDAAARERMAALVRGEFEKPLVLAAYLLGLMALAIHLSHGIQSALQTLGLSHPRYTPLLQKLSVLIAVLLALGFASMPVYFFASGASR
ncbi:MAG: succinate dehydrogenase cytochrome b subunit [Planctomycetes bacterium]|nr:succinate dehydrogenase cytochrome b subunit [Planctomycetota bacterium]